jgi:hypothetical protein
MIKRKAIENKPKQDVRLDDDDNYALNCYQKMNKIKLKTELNLSHLYTASYYLVLTQKNKVIKKFKIVKS